MEAKKSRDVFTWQIFHLPLASSKVGRYRRERSQSDEKGRSKKSRAVFTWQIFRSPLACCPGGAAPPERDHRSTFAIHQHPHPRGSRGGPGRIHPSHYGNKPIFILTNLKGEPAGSSTFLGSPSVVTGPSFASERAGSGQEARSAEPRI